jgi:hypothetical protein
LIVMGLLLMLMMALSPLLVASMVSSPGPASGPQLIP